MFSPALTQLISKATSFDLMRLLPLLQSMSSMTLDKLQISDLVTIGGALKLDDGAAGRVLKAAQQFEKQDVTALDWLNTIADNGELATLVAPPEANVFFTRCPHCNLPHAVDLP